MIEYTWQDVQKSLGSGGPMLSRPTKEALRVGRGVLAELTSELRSGYILVTQPEPLAQLGVEVAKRAVHLILADSLDRSTLERHVSAAPKDLPVLGIGGGVVMDTAKWLSHQIGAPLYLAPSILSVNACITNKVAVREAGRVVYEGFVEAKQIVVDVDLVRSAPRRLNRAGVGDLLSIHTALWDWRAAERAGYRPPVDETVARIAANVLDSIEAVASSIGEVSEAALEDVITGYAIINDLTVACGRAYMEEGSEHYLAYCLEHLAQRPFVHGEVVTLGVVVMSKIQGNYPERALSIAEQARVAWRPTAIGIDDGLLLRAILELRQYVAGAGLRYSVANEMEFDSPYARSLLAEL